LSNPSNGLSNGKDIFIEIYKFLNKREWFSEKMITFAEKSKVNGKQDF